MPSAPRLVEESVLGYNNSDNGFSYELQNDTKLVEETLLEPSRGLLGPVSVQLLTRLFYRLPRLEGCRAYNGRPPSPPPPPPPHPIWLILLYTPNGVWVPAPTKHNERVSRKMPAL